MGKVHASFILAALCFVGLASGCGQGSDDHASGTGGDTGHDSKPVSSASGSAGASGSGGAALGGQAANSSMSGGRASDSGGSAGASSGPAGGSGGSSTGVPVSTPNSGGRDAGSGSIGSSSRPDAGSALPRDAAASSGDAAAIPPLPVRQDAGVSFWAAAFASGCKPPAIGGRAEDDGHHKPGTNCMTSGCHLNPKTPKHHAGTDCRGSGCHNNGSPDGSGAPAFLFGGTAYRSATLVAEVAAEVGVKAGSSSYTACSASNGNFWVAAPSGTPSLTWTGASIRLRNANGEAPMMTTPAAGCNATSCHTGTLKLTAP